MYTLEYELDYVLLQVKSMPYYRILYNNMLL